MLVEPILQMKGINKSFPGVKALDGVDFDLYAGEVHALLGENGAGKSTLIKVLAGIYPKDSGEIIVNGAAVDIKDPNTARDLKISVIHQELVLVPHLSVAENIFLGHEPKKRNGLINFDFMYRKTEKVLKELDLNISARKKIVELTVSHQQMVEIVKAIYFESKIIVMDEPTSSIGNKDVEILFSRIHYLKKQGIGIVYISHRMSELQEVADRVSILRDGKYIGTKAVKDTNNDELIAMMVGRSITNYYTRTYNNFSDVVLKVDHLTTNTVRDVSFDLRKGEILGFSGLIGAGRTEAILGIMGLDKVVSGKIYLDGKELPPGIKVKDQINNGIVLVPEDRKDAGLFSFKTLRFNLTLKVLSKFIKGIVTHTMEERRLADDAIKKLSIRAANDQIVMLNLSGGNQQKAIIASWLAVNPKVLILDEPTRGIDVGSKTEIYNILNNLAQEGVAIIMISSELPEIINMSDRVAVMCEGRLTAILNRNEISQENIMQYAVAV
jgi:ABC-type sugar transport system ATPase subunit